MSATYDGYTYFTNDNSFIDHINRGKSKPYTLDLAVVKQYFTMFPHKNGTYIDIGAHIGTTIMPYSKMFQRIVGYDPSSNYDFLQKNIEYNNIKNCSVFNYGIFNKSGKGIVRQHGSNSGCMYFKLDDDGSIECKSLDDEMNRLNLTNVDFIKLDTEGSELYVLEGGLELIKHWKPFIQYEENGLSEKLYGISGNKIIDFLQSLGYLPFSNNNNNTNKFFYHPNDTLSIVPRTLYCFWTGTNKMSINRSKCLKQLYDISEANVKLIKDSESYNYMIPAFPFHPAFKFLSETHKADYLRMYFMHFFGGGYADIKMQKNSWLPYYQKILDDDSLYAIGYRELDKCGVAYGPVADNWMNLIGNGLYIFRPNNNFTQEWFRRVHLLLDDKLDKLKTNPASNPRDKAEYKKGYPIEWNELLGRIFHELNFKYRKNIDQSMSEPICSKYK